MEYSFDMERILEMAKCAAGDHPGMTVYKKPVTVELKGDYALFSRPEYRTEKVSYEVPTSSALRNLMQAIYWHPGLAIVPLMCAVKNKIVYEGIGTNGTCNIGSKLDKMYVVGAGRRLQMTSHYLRNVDYIVVCALVCIPDLLPQDEYMDKYYHQMVERIEKGKCFSTPYLGKRECTANFAPANLDDYSRDDFINESKDLGLMFYNYDYASQKEKSPPKAIFKTQTMTHGIVDYTKGDIYRC